MARLYNGILSDFTGTVGTVVGSRSGNGVSYIRSKSNKPRPKSTEAQKLQHSKFNAVVSVMRDLNPLLKVGLKLSSKASKMSVFNYATKCALENSIVEEAGQSVLDLSTILLSEGQLGRIPGAVAEIEDEQVVFTWSDRIDRDFESLDDKVYLVAYNATNRELTYSSVALRSDKSAFLYVPYSDVGDKLYFYLFFQSAEDPEMVSTSQFVGSAEIV